LKDSMKCVESRQLHKEDWTQERRVELGNNVGVRSVSMASEKGRNNGNEYATGLLEKIVDRNNLNQAYKRVKSNKGSHGVDGMKVDELLQYLKQHGDELKQSIMEGEYNPQPVRRVGKPKPDGGIRILGIPTVLDRMIQQAIAQILSPIFEEKFSNNSYGFRPNRSAKQAVLKAKEYIEQGYKWVVDIDLAKYFDTVNHDILMALIAKEIRDKRVLKLIRKYLQSGVMINGVTVENEEGCPQGGPLSPLLSNIMLNELDKELEKRGHKFCRYADDGNIFVKSKKAGERVMTSITNFLESKLKLKVNKEKSAVDRPSKRKFLGFSFYHRKGGVGIRIHEKSIKRFMEKVREITSRSNGKNISWKLEKLRQSITGWVNYFGISEMKSHAQRLDEWIRRRIRMCFWKQWKKIKTKHDNLVKLGIDNKKAWQFANTRKSYWHTANSHILATTLTNKYLKSIGYQSISERYSLVH